MLDRAGAEIPEPGAKNSRIVGKLAHYPHTIGVADAYLNRFAAHKEQRFALHSFATRYSHPQHSRQCNLHEAL